MQRSSCFLKFCTDYSIIAFGAALLLAVVSASMQAGLSAVPATAFSESARHVADVFDVHVAALMSAATLVIFSGLWRLAPTTLAGRWTLRAAVAALVAINWAAWVVALWWH